MASWQHILSLSWLGNLLSIVGLISIPLAVFLFFKSKSKASLSCYSEDEVLIGQENSVFPESINVFYEERKIKKLVRSKIYIWNSGNKTIDIKDVVEKNGLKISSKDGCDLLNCSIIKYSREISDFTCSIDEDGKSANLKFLYTDPGDGCLIEVLHNGNSEILYLSGNVKGMPMGISNVSESRLTKVIKKQSFAVDALRKPEFIAAVYGFIGLLIFSLGIYVNIFEKDIELKDSIFYYEYKSLYFTFPAMGLIFILFSIVVFYANLRRYPRSLLMRDK